MKTILITGINGYLGSKLAYSLSSKFKIIGLEYETSNLFRINKLKCKVYSSKFGIPPELFQNNKVDLT